MDIRCQQFTSQDISNSMLDMVGYRTHLYGKKVLENSCGEGNILALIVERYILSELEEKKSLKAIRKGLEKDIYAVEIVEDTYKKCISNLDAIASKYGIANVSWNVVNGDVLENPFKIKFDYVIGNPPYISYGNLEDEVRKFIKEKYRTCKKGKPDYCYAFIENAINYLNDTGKMVYLIPNSIFKNVFGKDLRALIAPYLTVVYDYPNRKLFEKALTSSAIMILEKGSYKEKFRYNNVAHKLKFELRKNQLSDKWSFATPRQEIFSEEITFDRIFKASITIATQRNNIFVIDDETRKKYEIERGAWRTAISPRNQAYGIKEYILFPYRIIRDVIRHYNEEDFKREYPNAYKYLEENKEELDLRDADAEWFEYGRSQAVQNMNKNKLVTSTVVTDNVKVYDVNRRAVPYSGIYIISEQGYDLSLARKILESKQFLEYVKKIGTPASGRSLRITADDINKFVFKVGDFVEQ